MINKSADTAQTIVDVIADRWSGRAYDDTIAVTKEQITALCEAARWAPSCFGDEPWRFIIWNKHQDKTNWQRALACLAQGNQTWAEKSSLLILAASVNTFSHNGSNNRWVGYDSGAASISMCLQATAMGLMSHQMGGFDSDKLKNTFSLPDNITCWAMIAIGHPADADSLDEEQRVRETAPRSRRSLAELFYYNGWQALTGKINP